MGCCTYFGTAILVASTAWGARYWYTYVGLPEWYWQARLPENVEQIDVTDTAMLKKVLFSGEPWLLQCYSGLPYVGQHLPAPYRVSPIFTQSLDSMRGLVRGGVLDCEKALPSNKSLVGKFDLVRRTQPLLIFASGGHKPKQVPANSVGSAYAVMAWVKPKAEPHVRSITSQKQLQARLTSASVPAYSTSTDGSVSCTTFLGHLSSPPSRVSPASLASILRLLTPPLPSFPPHLLPFPRSPFP